MTGRPSLTWAGMPRWSLKTLGLFLGLGILLVGLIWLNHFALSQIRERERYALAFEDIDCAPPPGMKRADFLVEAQYLGGLSNQLWLLDEDLTKRLAAAFARHPWVEKVERVEIGQPRQIQVRLVYRTPVLAVAPEKDKHGKKIIAIKESGDEPFVISKMIAVDAQGIVLPMTAELKGLPILEGKIPRPKGPAGQSWQNTDVHSAARTAAFLRPYQKRLRITLFEVTRDGLVLTMYLGNEGGVVLWGRAPGEERADEASAAQKLERLLNYCNRHGNLGSPHKGLGMGQFLQHDVRPRVKSIHGPYRSPAAP